MVVSGFKIHFFLDFSLLGILKRAKFELRGGAFQPLHHLLPSLHVTGNCGAAELSTAPNIWTGGLLDEANIDLRVIIHVCNHECYYMQTHMQAFVMLDQLEFKIEH